MNLNKINSELKIPIALKINFLHLLTYIKLPRHWPFQSIKVKMFGLSYDKDN